MCEFLQKIFQSCGCVILTDQRNGARVGDGIVDQPLCIRHQGKGNVIWFPSAEAKGHFEAPMDAERGYCLRRRRRFFLQIFPGANEKVSTNA